MRQLMRVKIGRNKEFQPVYIKDRTLHLLLVGKSGVGKTTLILVMIESDSHWGCSIFLVEPSGFLARDAYAVLRGKAHYCSLDNAISINPMMLPYEIHTIVEIIIEAVNQIVHICTPNTNFTVKMRSMLAEAIIHEWNANHKSLLYVRDYLKKQTGQGETRDGVTSRLDFILSDPRMEKILCGNNSISWGDLIQRGEHFILDCFGMGKTGFVFAGNIVSQGLKSYFRFERPKVYRPVSVYFDEAPLYVNENFADILREARKYQLAVCLSTQGFEVIPESLTKLMLNVGNIVCFKVGAREAGMIGREMNVDHAELQGLEKFHCAVMTPNEVAFCKAQRPVLVPKVPVKVMAKPKAPVKSQIWFEWEPYEPTTT